MWWVQLLIGFAIAVIGYLLMPKPKAPKPPAVREMENPTAEAGKPIPVVFGSMPIKSGNLLWYGEKRVVEETKGGGSGKK